MSHAVDQIHRNHRLRRILGLSLSGAALIGLVYFEGASARAQADDLDDVAEAYELEADDDLEADDLDDLDDAIIPNAVPTAVAPSGLGNATLAAATAETATTETVAVASLPPAPPSEPAVAGVTVPDLDGLSLYKARKQLKAVGLKISVRDEYKEKLPREYWGGYRVRKQKIEPGTEVKPGTTVRVSARMKRSYSMGY